MKFIQKYQVILSICIVVFLCGLLLLFIMSNLSSNNYTSKIGDTFTFGVKIVNNKVDDIICKKVDKDHIMRISEEDAVFLLHSGYYKIVEVSNDFEAIFYKPVFEGEDLFSKSVYKSYMKDLEKPNGDLIQIRYVPYMQYKDNAFAIVMPIDSNLENIENVDINNFLVYRYSQMQILRGNIEIEKIGLIPNELQPSF